MVNISVSVDVRKPILDMNTDETKYERSNERYVELPKIASKNDFTPFRYKAP